MSDLAEEFDRKWEEAKSEYPPDPALEETVKANLNLMQMIRELEKITKRER